jgi:hypothetical protein
MVLPLSRKATVPIGVAELCAGAADATVAVKVTCCPNVLGLGDEVTPVLLGTPVA